MNASTGDSARDKSQSGPILALETTGKSASVAIEWEDGRGVSLETDRATGSARTLAPAIDAILKKHSVDVSELAAIAVTVGPGSFTGLRVGVTMAKTMAYALKISSIAVDSLETIAWKAAYDFSQTDGTPGWPEESFKIWTVLDAYRGELFAAFWEIRLKDTALDCKAIVPSQLVDAVQWSESVANSVHSQERIVLAGPGLARCRQFFEGSATTLGFEVRPDLAPNASMVAKIGRHKLKRNEIVDAFRLMPVYLRGSAAEEKRRKA